MLRARLTLTLSCALAAGLWAGPSSGRASSPPVGTRPQTSVATDATIMFARTRAAVLGLRECAAESFGQLPTTSLEKPWIAYSDKASLRLVADYEGLFVPRTAGWIRFAAEAWRIGDSERELLASDEAEAIAFGPSRHAGYLKLPLELKPGLYHLVLIASAAARPVGAADWCTDRETADLWVLVTSEAWRAATPTPSALPLAWEAQGAGALGASSASDDGAPDPTPVARGLAVGSQRGVAGDVVGGAVNFDTGHNSTIVVAVGQPARVWSDYELWWSEGAQAEAGASLAVRHRPISDAEAAPLAQDAVSQPTIAGPLLLDGNLAVQVSFAKPGRYPLVAILDTHVKAANQSWRDSDTIPFTVVVVEQPPAWGTISGTVTAEGGEVLEGVAVEATDRQGTQVARAFSGPDGRYIIERLAEGEYLVHAIGGDLNYLDEWWRESPTIRLAEPVKVPAGQNVGDIDFTLEAGGTITGRVTDADGAGLGGIEIAAGFLRSDAEPAGIEPVQAEALIVARTRTNEDGYYSLLKLRANAYWVRTSDPQGRYLTEYYDDKPDFAHADKVWVKAGQITEGIDFALQAGGMISGRVTGPSSAGERVGLPGIVVQARDVADPDRILGHALTDGRGDYTIGALAEGKYLVVASDPSGRYDSEWYREATGPQDALPVPVAAGIATTGIDFSLQLQNARTELFVDPARVGAIVGSSARIEVGVVRVEDLAAFDVELRWDPAVLRVDEAEVGDFLASTGRTVVPLAPVIDNDEGRLRVGAASYGEQPGVDGSGSLFAVRFTALAVGQTTFAFSASILATPAGRPIEHDARGGVVIVSDCMLGDFDCNCVIDIQDVMAVVLRWGTREGDPDYDPTYDLNNDGQIDIIDVQIVAGLWGRRCDQAIDDPAAASRHAGEGAASVAGRALRDGPLTLAPAGGAADGLQAGPSVTLSSWPEQPAPGTTVTIVIGIDDAMDLAGFDLWLGFDPAKLRFVSAEIGDFLGQTGRTVFPLGPTVESDRVGLGGFSLSGAPAPSGTGTLATCVFEVRDGGSSTLEVAEAVAVDSLGQSSAMGGASVTVDSPPRPGSNAYLPMAAQRP